MSDPNQPSTPAGWYPDGQGGQRWWDGTQWTEHTQPPAGQAAAPAAPEAGAPPAQPAPPKVPGADLPTQVAPNRSTDYPAAGQPGPPGQPGYGAPQQAYGAAQAGGQYGQPGPGQPGQPPFGQGYVGSTGGGGNRKKLAIIGGAVVGLILVVVVAFLVLGALFGGGPEDVADDYLSASADGDIEELCELSSKNTQEAEFESYDVDNCGDYTDAIEDSSDFEEFEQVRDDFDVSYELGDVKEDDDTAEVKFTSTTEYNGDDEELGDLLSEEESEGTIYLVKEDGDWKVDGNKSDGL
ncbi:MAG TPA: DUF2510 domain-containing protein [Nocardioides sp.]|nr:DUF2510 domain-containing protein [Nocardioides sp.]